jgi:hypothetical protein
VSTWERRALFWQESRVRIVVLPGMEFVVLLEIRGRADRSLLSIRVQESILPCPLESDAGSLRLLVVSAYGDHAGPAVPERAAKHTSARAISAIRFWGGSWDVSGDSRSSQRKADTASRAAGPAAWRLIGVKTPFAMAEPVRGMGDRLTAPRVP